MKLIILISLFVFHCLSEKSWGEDENGVITLTYDDENHRTDWGCSFAGGLFIKHYDHFLFKSNCCNPTTKYFDGVSQSDLPGVKGRV